MANQIGDKIIGERHLECGIKMEAFLPSYARSVPLHITKEGLRYFTCIGIAGFAPKAEI